MDTNFNDFKIDSKNRIYCTIEGLISESFSEKKVNGRQIFQSKLYSTNPLFTKNLIKLINNIDHNTQNIFMSPSILLNFWHTEVFLPYKEILNKGTKIKAEGVITFKVYKRDYGEQRLHLFFAVNRLVDINKNTLIKMYNY